MIDKITILEIKCEKIVAPEAAANVLKELTLLVETVAREALSVDGIAGLKAELAAANRKLWDIEDRLREKEAAKAFDDEFIALARAVYFTNDARARLKREINALLGSGLVEEKSYAPY